MTGAQAGAEEDARLVAQYLAHAQVEKRLAPRTLALYALDLDKLLAEARRVPVALSEVRHAHVRRWVAQMHAQGRSDGFEGVSGGSRPRSYLGITRNHRLQVWEIMEI